jgi:hypothetical protein
MTVKRPAKYDKIRCRDHLGGLTPLFWVTEKVNQFFVMRPQLRLPVLEEANKIIYRDIQYLLSCWGMSIARPPHLYIHFKMQTAHLVPLNRLFQPRFPYQPCLQSF